MRKLAIGDIHGCNKTFKALLDQINLSKDDELTLLGDYIDRGPDSKGVIDTIINLQSSGYQVRALRGNHDIQKMYKRWTNKSFFSKPVLNLDAGCIFGLSGLVAVDLTNQKFYEQENIDRRY